MISKFENIILYCTLYRCSLAGVINFDCPKIKSGYICELRHYTAHTRKTNCYWNIHDDLMTTVKNYKNFKTSNIKSHIIFYIYEHYTHSVNYIFYIS